MKRACLVLVLVLAGCCSSRDSETSVSTDSYKAALKQIRSNVAAVRSDVATIEYDKGLKKAHLQLMDATVHLCDDTLAGKNAGKKVAK